MNREEFSALLKQKREAAECSLSEMGRRTWTTFVQMKRMEAAENSYNMGIVTKYLSSVGCCLQLSHPSFVSKCNTYEEVQAFIVRAIGIEKQTSVSLHRAAQCSRSAVSCTMSGRTTMRVDLFLKLTEILHVNIQIVPV